MSAMQSKPRKETPIDIEVKQALRQVSALRTFTRMTGTVTTYMQNRVLRALLGGFARVALILSELEKGGTQ